MLTNAIPRLLPVVILIFTIVVMPFQPASAEPQAPGVPGTGSLLLRMAEGYEVRTALETGVDIEVNGLVARVSVRQAFINNGEDWAEGVYVFPLPDESAVDRLRLHIGERFIEGEIREKEAARAEYEQARREGRRTSLVEQERPNLFTTSVANIAPGETVVVEIEYLETLRYDNGTFSLRFPMTMTPRYMPGTPLPDRQGSGWSDDTTSVPDASRISPPVVVTEKAGKVTLEVRLDAGMPLQSIVSRYHRIDVSDGPSGAYRVSLQDGAVSADHDFELNWIPATGSEPEALLFEETHKGEPHYLLMLVPPSSDAAGGGTLPREMIFVIDTSGSMHGTSLAQAKKALSRALERLDATDRFNVIEFNSTTTPLFSKSVAASGFNLRHAQGFVASLQSNGGTEMRAALDIALRSDGSESHFRQVVFITDGAVGNEDELFRMIDDRIGNARLFTVGIGSAPNSWFMRKAAETGRGSFTMISKLSEVGERMEKLFARIEQPQVTDISLHWPGGTIVDAYPGIVPDLYAGEPVRVSAKIAGPIRKGDVVTVTGNTPEGSFTRHVALATTGSESDGGSGVAALWARARIDHLMDVERRSADAETVNHSIVDTAISYHLVSKYTSLIAVDRTPARTADANLRRDLVPNALPWGQDMNAIFGFPATATGAEALRLSGYLLLGLAGLLAIWRSLGVDRAHGARSGHA